jgi:ribonucleoside-triphosphate reductase
MNKCQSDTEVYSRVVGFYRPVNAWNPGKKEEFGNRSEYENLNLTTTAKMMTFGL